MSSTSAVVNVVVTYCTWTFVDVANLVMVDFAGAVTVVYIV